MHLEMFLTASVMSKPGIILLVRLSAIVCVWSTNWSNSVATACKRKHVLAVRVNGDGTQYCPPEVDLESQGGC